MINEFNVGDIIQSLQYSNEEPTIYYLVTHVSITKQLYKFKNISYDIELLFNMDDSTHRYYKVVSKAQRD